MTDTLWAEGLTDEQINAMLDEIDAIARDVDIYEFGLPIADDARAQMREVIRAALAAQAVSWPEEERWPKQDWSNTAPAEAKEEALTLAQMYESGRDLAVEEIQEAARRHRASQERSNKMVTDFEQWLNERRNFQVAEFFHDIVAKYESAIGED